MMASTNVSPLLALPREVRDIIIDNVLLSSLPAPLPAPHATPSGQLTKRWNTTEIPPMMPLSALVHTNAQLHDETLQRVAKLGPPLILDILVLKTGYLKCTWISRPCKKPDQWQNIDMKVQVRTQPISTKLWETYRPTHDADNFDFASRTDNMCAYRWGKRPRAQVLAHLIVFAVSKAVLGVLWADAAGMRTCPDNQNKATKRENKLGPVNSINKLTIEIAPARDEKGAVVESPYWGSDYQRYKLCYTCENLREAGFEDPDPHYDPNQDLQDLSAKLLNSMWIKTHVSHSYIAVQSYEADHKPLLTHIGTLIFVSHTSDGEGRSEETTELSLPEVMRRTPHDPWDRIKLLRNEMGWDDE